MISNTSSTNGTPPPSLLPERGPRKASSAGSAGSENLSTAQAQRLQAALEANPEIRPEMVAHGVRLAVDPNYPPLEIIENVAKLIVSSEDLSNRE